MSNGACSRITRPAVETMATFASESGLRSGVHGTGSMRRQRYAFRKRRVLSGSSEISATSVSYDDTRMRVIVGTSGYSYKEWKGTFYPEDLPAAKMLSFYAGHF